MPDSLTALFSVNNDLLRSVINDAGIGVWEIDVPDEKIIWDERCCSLTAVKHQAVFSFEEALVNAGDHGLQMFRHSVAEASSESNSFNVNLKIESGGFSRWINFSGKKINSHNRIAGTARDVSNEYGLILPAPHTDHELLALFDQSPVALATIKKEGLTFTSANAFYGELVGRKPSEIIGKPLFEALPELAGQGFDQLLNGVIRTGIPFIADSVGVNILRNNEIETIYVNLAYQPIRNSNNEVTSIFVVATDVTPQVKAKKETEEGKAFGELLSNSVPAMIFYLDNEQRYTTYNETFMKWYNVDASEAKGQTVKDFIGEEAYARIKPYLERAFSGERVQFEMPAPIRLKPAGWLNIVYTPNISQSGEVRGVIVHATDVTQSKQTEISLRESEVKFRSLIEDAPFPTSLYVGNDLIIDTANEAMIKLWGKSADVIGMPLELALPELEGQPFIGILRDIMQTGETYHAKAEHADLVVNGKLQRFWFNYIYKPLLDENGNVYAIMNMAVDITDQFHAQRKVEDSEARLRALITSAPTPIAIFLGEDLIIDLPNQAFIDVVSKGPDIAGKPFGQVMPELEVEGQPFLDILRDIYRNGSTFRADGALAKIMVDGVLVEKYFNITFSPLRDSKGKIYGILDISVDVTDAVLAQRKIADNEKALEQEVQVRTEELAAAIEELKATNEELAYSNEQLTRSNDDLTQYAYVASHDLQEPLRKIQVFADLLKTSEHVSGEGERHLSKIIESAERMRLLIHDLLNFSRLLKSDSLFQQVDLNETLKNVIGDFELMANEKGAMIKLDDMPEIEAVGLQMNQLFYNLISNSLKFTRNDVVPEISITVKELDEKKVTEYIRNPYGDTKYYMICIKDNGIGFEKKYAEQIFEVFRRLHTRDVYPGSGIGLALCRKITLNHNGVLFTESIPGEGTSFYLILPGKQPVE